METTLQHFRSTELLHIVSTVRPEWGVCNWVMRSTSPSSSESRLIMKTGDSLLLVLEFAQSKSRWAVRLPTDYGVPAEYWAPCLVPPLLFIETALPQLPAPRIHSYSFSYDGPVGVPYILLDWIEGKPLPPFTDTWPRREQRYNILDELSDILLDLIFCPLDHAQGIRYYGMILPLSYY